MPLHDRYENFSGRAIDIAFLVALGGGEVPIKGPSPDEGEHPRHRTETDWIPQWIYRAVCEIVGEYHRDVRDVWPELDRAAAPRRPGPAGRGCARRSSSGGIDRRTWIWYTSSNQSVYQELDGDDAQPSAQLLGHLREAARLPHGSCGASSATDPPKR